jgi:RNA polymerase sigma-70 factor (ECF subfamily)
VLSVPVAPALDPDDAQAIRRCQRGDRSAFEPVVRRYMQRASFFALGLTGDQEEALDASQEAFIRAYRAIGGFDASRPFYPWFHRILRNVCLTRLARTGRSREVPLEDNVDIASTTVPGALDVDPAAALERTELRRIVWEGLGDLSVTDREILVLREFQDLSYSEIAQLLEIPQGTVMSRLHSARRRLRERLEPLLGVSMTSGTLLPGTPDAGGGATKEGIPR